MKSLGALIVVVAVIAASANAATPVTQAQRTGNAFARDYNKESDANMYPYRISAIKCWPSRAGADYVACFVTTRPRSGSKLICGPAVIDKHNYEVMTSSIVRCSEDPKKVVSTY